MKRGSVTILVVSLLFALLALPASGQSGKSVSYYLNHINPRYMVTPEEAYEWHVYKDKSGPTYAGSESWRSFLAFSEKRLKEYGVVEIKKN